MCNLKARADITFTWTISPSWKLVVFVVSWTVLPSVESLLPCPTTRNDEHSTTSRQTLALLTFPRETCRGKLCKLMLCRLLP